MEKDEQNTRTVYKDSLFTKIFSQPEYFKSVYGAILGKDISDKEVIPYNNDPMLTVDIRNDVAMLVEGKMIVFVEHQSTINYNMPLRMLWYLAAAYRNFIGDQLQTVFGQKQIELPKPEFYVFYAGGKPWEKTHLSLSDAYKILDREHVGIINAELHVEVVNMRDKDNPVMKRCEEAHVYIELIERIENYIKAGKTRDEAIHVSLIEFTQKNSILKQFLEGCELEVKNMLSYQLTLEESVEHAVRIRSKEIREDIFEEAMQQGIQQGMQQTAKNALNLGFTIEQASKISGLSEDEIRKLG